MLNKKNNKRLLCILDIIVYPDMISKIVKLK